MTIEATTKTANYNNVYSQFINKPKIQTQTELPQAKPDTVELSTKKKVATTGIGAVIGGLIGGIKANSNKSKQIMASKMQQQLKQGKEQIVNDLANKIADIAVKIRNGVELSADEKEMAEDFSLPSFIKFYKEGTKPYEQFRNFKDYRQIVGASARIESGIYLDMEHQARLHFYDAAAGKMPLKEFGEHFETWYDEFKEAFQKNERVHELLDALKNNTPFEGYEPNDIPMLWGLVRTNATVVPYGNIGKGCEEKYCGKLYQQLEENIKNSMNTMNKKQIIKSAGIGAVIVGGLALAGTLIYNHAKK